MTPTQPLLLTDTNKNCKNIYFLRIPLMCKKITELDFTKMSANTLHIHLVLNLKQGYLKLIRINLLNFNQQTKESGPPLEK